MPLSCLSISVYMSVYVCPLLSAGLLLLTSLHLHSPFVMFSLHSFITFVLTLLSLSLLLVLLLPTIVLLFHPRSRSCLPPRLHCPHLHYPLLSHVPTSPRPAFSLSSPSQLPPLSSYLLTPPHPPTHLFFLLSSHLPRALNPLTNSIASTTPNLSEDTEQRVAAQREPWRRRYRENCSVGRRFIRRWNGRPPGMYKSRNARLQIPNRLFFFFMSWWH